MDIPALQASPAADAAVGEIVRYGLERNVVELAAYGFTVIPPEKTAAAPDFVPRLRDAILRTHGARNDDPIDDYRTAELRAGFKNNWWLLEEDEAFVDAASTRWPWRWPAGCAARARSVGRRRLDPQGGRQGRRAPGLRPGASSACTTTTTACRRPCRSTRTGATPPGC